MPNIYQVTAIITPVVTQGVGGLPPRAQQLGNLLGMSLPTSPLSLEIISLLNSNILREKIIEKYNLLPVLFYQQWDEEKRIWKKTEKGIPFLIQKIIKKIAPANPKEVKREMDVPEIWDGLRTMDKIVKVNNNFRENTIKISVNFPDSCCGAETW